MTAEHKESLLRIKQVSERVGFSRSEIYKRMKIGTFPKPIKMGRLSVWIASEVNHWVLQTIQQAKEPSTNVRK